MSIKIPVEAKLEQSSVQAGADQIVKHVDKVSTSLKKVSTVKIDPFSKDVLKNFDKAEESLRRFLVLSRGVAHRMVESGQTNVTSISQIDFHKLFPADPDRARRVQQAAYASAGIGEGSSPGAGSQGGAWSDAGRGVVSSGLRAAGPVGGVIDRSMAAGMSGGVGAGLAGLVGGLAALGIGKLIGTIRDKVGVAEQQAIGYDTLKRTLGDVNVSFDVLSGHLKEAARGLDMTFDESLRLGTQFTKLSGISQDQYRTLYDEVTNAGGMARSFGLDPAQSTAFFAQMRMLGVTRNSQESRDLALMISEGVAKSGAFSKMGDVMDAIASYAASQTRSGMTPANVAGYAEMLMGMVGSKRAGMDPSGSAAILGAVNASISRGGSAGEAGQNFLFSALGARLGLNPIQARVLQEQGAFGTGASTFGAGSVYADFMGATGPGANSQATNLQMIREKLGQIYGGRKELMADAMANLLGLNITQAMALSMVSPQALGGLSARLKGNGISLSDVNATGLSRIAQIEADGSLSEDEKNRRIREAATQNQEETEGSRTRATINGVERAVVDLASKLVGPINDIRSGIMYMAGEGKKSAREVMESMAQIDLQDGIRSVGRRLDPRINAIEDRREDLQSRLRSLDPVNLAFTYRDRPDVLAEKMRERAEVERELAASGVELKKLQDEKSALIKRENNDHAIRLQLIRGESPASVGISAGGGRGFVNPPTVGAPTSRGFGSASLFDAVIQQESGGRHRDANGNLITSSAGAQGIAQLMPGTARNPGFGITPARDDSEAENRRVGREYLDAMLRRYGGDRAKALAAYNAGPGRVDAAIAQGGDNWLAMLPAETRNYVPSVLGRAGEGTPLPVPAAGSGQQQISVSVNAQIDPLRIIYPNGAPAGAPTSLNVSAGPPTPSGAARQGAR